MVCEGKNNKKYFAVPGGQRLLTGKFPLTYRKKRVWKVEKFKKLQNEEATFFIILFFSFFSFFFFFFFFFCFSLFKPTKICFGPTKKEIFYREKAVHAGKKIRKNDFAPSEKFSCYAPELWLNSIKACGR